MNKKYCFLFLSFVLTLSILSLEILIYPVYANDASDFANQFDFVETFDNLPDWRGTGYGNVFNDGPSNEWNYYSQWASNPDLNADWIADHGASKVWGGSGKSLRMDLSSGGNIGPSRFGRYFGTGTPDSGYSDLHIFWMTKFSNNYFPRKPDGSWTYYSYYKFGTFMTGFEDVQHYDSSVAGLGSQAKGYGRDYIIPGLSLWNYGTPCSDNNDIRLKNTFDTDFGGPNKIQEVLWTDGCFENLFGEWFGLEYYLKTGTPGKADGHITIWLYDSMGNGTKIYDADRMMLSAGHNYKWNKFFFGGNKHWKNSDYPGLDHEYYVDDFIIDSGRIGPKYFEIINPPSAPVSASIISIAGSSITVGWSFNSESDIDHYVVYWGSSSKNDTGGTYPNKSGSISKTQNTYTITGLTMQQTYFFAVKAVDSRNQESDFSTEFSTLSISSPQNDFHANNGNYKSFTIAGKAGANDSVEVFANVVTSLGVVTADANGNWAMNVDFSAFTGTTVSLTAVANALTSPAVTGVIKIVPPDPPTNIKLQ